MKKRYTDYIQCMTDGDIEKIEYIISKQYRKFVKLYRMLEKHSDDITTIKYEPKNDSTLDVYVEVSTKRKLESMKDSVDAYIEQKGFAGKTLLCDKKGLFISISMDE